MFFLWISSGRLFLLVDNMLATLVSQLNKYFHFQEIKRFSLKNKQNHVQKRLQAATLIIVN